MGVIICHANLCDPLEPAPFGVDALVQSLIHNATALGFNHSTDPSHIFITGHSLGAIGARHFVDQNKGYAGLGIFGTQFTGDHEDFLGNLGYPVDLAAFPMPLLALNGELDQLSIAHTATLYGQSLNLEDAEKPLKPVVIIPGMDHSDFCPGFNVTGDLISELPRQQATTAIGHVAGAWIDVVVKARTPNAFAQAVEELAVYASNSSYLVSSWRTANTNDVNGSWCANLQVYIASLSPQINTNLLNVADVMEVDSLATLEHCHTNVTLNAVTGMVDLTNCAFYANTTSSGLDFATAYASNSEVDCKMVSPDKLAQVLNVTIDTSKMGTCRDANIRAYDTARTLLLQSSPQSVARFDKYGRTFEWEQDAQALAGPLWVFLSHMSFDDSADNRRGPIKVGGAALLSTVTSPIFPGNLYCKVLSVAKAIEIIQTVGLTERLA